MSAELPQLRIRRAGTDDATVLAKLGAVTFRQSYAGIIPPGELDAYTAEAFSVEKIRSELANPNIIYLLAVVNEDICGYAKLEPTAPPAEVDSPKPVELVRLYAAPGLTGKGVGTALLTAAMQAAEAAGYRSCWLRVWQGNERAIAFYRKWGFTQFGSEPYCVSRACETVLLMVRRFTAGK
ncbi:MAG: GNAT family N-acetyltransferase [Planctomycetota bacterium]|jgi:ribosomal protein S18 acetylase RimI-like enzyme